MGYPPTLDPSVDGTRPRLDPPRRRLGPVTAQAADAALIYVTFMYQSGGLGGRRRIYGGHFCRPSRRCDVTDWRTSPAAPGPTEDLPSPSGPPRPGQSGNPAPPVAAAALRLCAWRLIKRPKLKLSERTRLGGRQTAERREGGSPNRAHWKWSRIHEQRNSKV